MLPPHLHVRRLILVAIVRVTINGTNISTMVDGAGPFTMKGVLPGIVTLTFTGEGVSASLTLNHVNAGDEIRMELDD